MDPLIIELPSTTGYLWSQAEAVKLCIEIEKIAPICGFHTALTGGCLYSHGLRKDCDILFYCRRPKEPDKTRLLDCLTKYCGIDIVKDCGFIVKATFSPTPGAVHQLDLFFPETEEYDEPYHSS